MGLKTKRANFRQKQVFLSCLPIMENNNDVKHEIIVFFGKYSYNNFFVIGELSFNSTHFLWAE